MIELNKIYCENCLETMSRMPDNFIDCIITDPPYSGLQAKSRGDGRFRQTEHHIEFDDMSERAFLLFIKPIFKEAYRVLKLGGHLYCFTDWKQLRNMADCLELSSLKLVNIICWDKGHFGTGSGYRSQSEYVLLFSKGLPNIFNYRNIGNVIKCKRENNAIHPHQKPVDLLKIFIGNSTIINGVVYDLFVGSGSVIIASIIEKRNWIGSEISQEYVDIANKRIQPYLDQKTLF